MKHLNNESVAALINPRPDLIEDADLWARLLLKAYPIDGEDPEGLFWILHGLRCVGARLRLGATTAVLEPGEISAEAYAAYKAQYLEPHRPKLLQLLREVGSVKAIARERT